MKPGAILIAVVLVAPQLVSGYVVTPVPTPAYAILGTVAGYRAAYVDSSKGITGTSHRIPYRRVGNYQRTVTVRVTEPDDPTWVLQDVEATVRAFAAQAPHLLEVRTIAGQNVIYLQSGRGGDYFWVSGGDKAVHISWNRIIYAPDGSDSVEELPEEFLIAYLERLPSDLHAFEFDEDRTRQFIRNEIDQEFYYIDKVMEELAAVQDPQKRVGLVGDVDQRLDKVVKLGAKYFGGPTDSEWTHEVIARFEAAHPGGGKEELYAQPQVKARVEDLKQWWAAHRDDRIVLATPTAPAPPETPSAAP